MSHQIGRRVALGASAAESAVNGMIFCHTMGTAADIAAFKGATGDDFNVTCWSSNTDTLTKLASEAGRTFDIFNLSRQFIPVAIQRSLVAPLDFSKIPNA
jgi:spermidine/putrescine-binding protein